MMGKLEKSIIMFHFNPHKILRKSYYEALCTLLAYILIYPRKKE